MKILIIGNYGVTNLGDELILLGLLTGIFEGNPDAEISIMSVSPRETEDFLKPYFPGKSIRGVHRIPFGFRSLSAFLKNNLFSEVKYAFRDADLVLLGGGGLFADDESIFTVPFWYIQASLALLYKKPLVTYGLGILPIRGRLGRYLTNNLLKRATFLGLRDEISHTSLPFLKNSFLTVDPIFALKEFFQYLPSQIEPRKKPYIVLSLRDYHGWTENLYKEFAQCLDRIIDIYGLEIVFIPFQTRHTSDLEILNKIIIHSDRKEHIFCFPSLDLPEICSFICHAKFVLAMRFHANLLSLALGKAFLPIGYSRKVMTFFAQNYLPILDFVLPFPQWSTKKAFRGIEEILKNLAFYEEQSRNLAEKLYKTSKDNFRQFNQQISVVLRS